MSTTESIESQIDPSRSKEIVQIRFIDPEDSLPVAHITFRDVKYFRYILTGITFGDLVVKFPGTKYYRFSDLCNKIMWIMEQMGHFKYELLIKHHE